ncbi:MAG TPA: hypothetical protein VF541_19940 [Longimicrobium sp.]
MHGVMPDISFDGLMFPLSDVLGGPRIDHSRFSANPHQIAPLRTFVVRPSGWLGDRTAGGWR